MKKRILFMTLAAVCVPTLLPELRKSRRMWNMSKKKLGVTKFEIQIARVAICWRSMVSLWQWKSDNSKYSGSIRIISLIRFLLISLFRIILGVVPAALISKISTLLECLNCGIIGNLINCNPYQIVQIFCCDLNPVRDKISTIAQTESKLEHLRKGT